MDNISIDTSVCIYLWSVADSSSLYFIPHFRYNQKALKI